MTFAQPLPWWVLAVVVPLLLFMAWRAGWWAGMAAGPPATVPQRAALVALRAAALLLLLGMVMRPVQLLPDPAARGVVAVLVDVSRSMALADAEGRRRIDAAVTLIRERVLPASSERLAVEMFAFADEVRTVPVDQVGTLAPTGAATDVARALEAIRRRSAAQPVAGVLVVSDGGFTLRAEDDDAGRLSAPVYTLGVGGREIGRDREVRQVTAGEASVAGASIDLTATIVSTGYAREPVEVRLSGSGRPLDVRRVAPAGEGVPSDVVFRVAPDAASATLYTIEVVAGDGEITTENNRRSVLVPPAGRARRVLLVEGAPGFEHSFLKRAIEQDPALELDAVVRKGSNEAGDETFYVQAEAARGRALTRGFPSTRQELFLYDALVLANIETDTLGRDQLALVADFVSERGGGLLVLGSRSLQPEAVAGTVLEELLPVEVSDRRTSGVARAELSAPIGSGVLVTADGATHPVMRLGATPDETRARWAGLPSLPSVVSVGQARPGATVLAVSSGTTGVARPLVAVQRFGRGRVLVFAGEASWRWRMMLPSTDTTYPTFWRQATRWLASAAPEAVSVRTRATGPGRVEVVADVRDAGFRASRDAEVQVRLRRADGSTDVVFATPVREADGVYRAEVRVGEGVTRVEVEAGALGKPLGRTTAWARSGSDEGELVEPRRNDAQLTRLAERHGGRLIEPAEVAATIDEMNSSRASAAPLIERDLWHTPWLLALVATLLVGEWALRRRWGLR